MFSHFYRILFKILERIACSESVHFYITFFRQYTPFVLPSLQFLETALVGVNKLSLMLPSPLFAILILLKIDYFLNFGFYLSFLFPQLCFSFFFKLKLFILYRGIAD